MKKVIRHHATDIGVDVIKLVMSGEEVYLVLRLLLDYNANEFNR